MPLLQVAMRPMRLPWAPPPPRLSLRGSLLQHRCLLMHCEPRDKVKAKLRHGPNPALALCPAHVDAHR